MKGLFSKIRISRKIVLAFGGVLVLCGATGAAAVFIGADVILGPSYADLNGLECTEVQTVTIKKKDRFWVRKYITTDDPGDGMTRVKTALRVARTLYEREKPDLVQVVVLDKNGPTDRSAMRGRAVGADVVYIADPSRVPEEANGHVFTARYVDKLANAEGLFYGEKIALPEAEIEKLVARLDDKTDCIKPEVVVPEGHGAPAEHGAPASHGEVAPAEGHGEAAPAEGHGAETPAAEQGAEAPADAHGAAAPEQGAAESKGWLDSITGMVFGSDEKAPAEDGHGADADHDATAPANGHDAAPTDHAIAPADGHAEAAADDHAAVPAEAPASAHDEAPADAHSAAPVEADAHGADAADAAPAHEMPTGESVQGEAAVPHAAEADAHAKATGPAPAPAESGGWFSSLKGMVLGSDEETPAPATSEDAAAGHDAAPAEAAVPEEAAAPAEHDAASAEDAAAAEHEDAPEPAAEGKAKAAGAAWLEKLRSQPLEGASAAPAAGEIPAEDSAVLPPKASVKADAEKHAEATN
ncbi:MAG: hypothetical protein K0M60_08610 [Hydrogenophaga sp.]|nr:hypothetical protein [Hydrogenophaga sp.]